MFHSLPECKSHGNVHYPPRLMRKESGGSLESTSVCFTARNRLTAGPKRLTQNKLALPRAFSSSSSSSSVSSECSER